MEEVGIKITADDKEAKQTIAELQKMIKKLMGPHKVEIDDSDIKRAKSEIDNMGKAADNEAKKKREVKIGDNAKEAEQHVSQIDKKIDQVTRKPRRIKWDFMSGLGSSLQTIGNTLQNMTQSSMIGNAIQGLKQSVLSQLSSTMTSGIGQTISRYDTMKTFTPVMKAIGFEAKDADQAIQALDKHAQGLPTSLDDLVSVTKRYAAATGDLNKSAKIAIALDNAFLASGANDVQKYQGMNQIADLLSAGKLRSTEWTSLIKSMPVGIREIGKELGYTGKKQAQFTSELQAGKISSEKFLNALIKVGNEGKLIQYADISKQTLSAAGKNLSTAVARMGQGVLEQLDSTLKKETGGGLIDHLLGSDEKKIKGVKGQITDLQKSIEGWIEKHPEKIGAWLKAIEDFNWKGFAKGAGTFFRITADGLSVLSKLSNKGPLGSIAGFFLAGGGNAFGSIFQNVGGLIRGIGRIGGGIARVSEAGGKIGKIADKIPGKSVFTKIHDIFSGADTAGHTMKKATTSWKGMAQGLVQSILPGVTALAYTGIIAGVVKIAQLMGNTKVSWKAAAKNFSGAAAMMAAASGFMSAVGSIKNFAAGKFASFGKLATSFKGLGELVQAGSTLVDTGVFYLVSKLVSEMSKMDLGSFKDIQKKFWNISLVIAEMKGVFTGLGTLSAIPIAGQVSAILDVIGAAEALLNASALSKVIDALTRFKDLDMDALPTKKDLDKISGFIEDVAESMSGLNDIDYSGSERAEQVSENLDIIVKNTSEVAKKLPQAIKNMEAAYNAIKENDWVKDTGSEQMAAIKDTMAALSNWFLTDDETAKEMASGLNAPVSGSLSQKPSKDKATVNGSENATSIVSNLKALVTQTAEMATNIPKLIGNLKTAYRAIESNPWISQRKSEQMQGIKKALDNVAWIVTGSYSKELASNTDQFAHFAENVAQMKVGFQALGQVLDAAKKLNGKFKGSEGSEGWVKILSTHITDFVSALKRAVSGAQEFYNNANVLKQGIILINTSLGLANTDKTNGVKAFTNALNAMIKKVQAVSSTVRGKGAEWKRQLLDGFKGTASGINKEVSNIGKNIASDTIRQLFYNAGANFGKSMVEGMKAVLGSFDASSTIQSSTTARSGRTHTENGSSGTLLYTSTGGLIGKNNVQYLRKGGKSVNFRPKGTDTVPTMLTPGEFVQKKTAVKFWGTDFMRKVNNMDLQGALKHLYARGGMMMPKVTVKIDKSRHNNAKVIQNIHNGSQQYSYRRANRYVRGLA